MPSKIQRRIDESNNPMDVYCNQEGSCMSTGLDNTTGNYIISKGSDLSTPCFSVNANNGDVIVSNNLMVMGTTTISNTTSVNLETTNLSVGLKNENIITSMTQVNNENTPNHQQLANIAIESPYSFSNNNSVRLNGLTSTIDGSSKNYNILYPSSSFTNVYDNVNLVTNSVKNNSNNNFGFTTNTSPIFNQTSNLSDYSFYFRSAFNAHYGATLVAPVKSDSTTISVNSTNGWAKSGNLLLRDNSSTITLSSAVNVTIGSTNNMITVNDASSLSVGNYLAGTNSTGDYFVLGQISVISGQTITFSSYIPGSIALNSAIYKLLTVPYTGIKNNAFTVSPSNLSSLSADITVDSGKYLQVFSGASFINSSELFYFNNDTSSTSAPYVLSISTIASDTAQVSIPIFDNSPPDIKLVGNTFFTLNFDSTIANPNKVASFTLNGATIGELQSNTTNDGMFSLDFNFADSSQEDASKSICVGSTNSGTDYQDSLYFTKMNNNSKVPHFTMDYTNNSLKFKNGASVQNNTSNEINLNATNGVKVTSIVDSTSSTTGSLVVNGGAGFAKSVKVGNNLGVSGTATVSSLSVSDTTVIHSIENSSSSTTGALIVDGGAGFAKAVNVGTTLGVTGLATVGSLNVTDTSIINSTTDSTSSTTGSLIVKGGAGFAKAVNVGTTLDVIGSTQIHSSTDSTTSTTGALIVSGGAGFSKDVNIGNNLGVTGNATVSSTTDSTSSTTGALKVNGGAGFAKAVNVGTTLGVTGLATVGSLVITDTTIINSTADSISSTTGALKVDGGAGFAKAVNIGSTLGVTGLATIGSLDVTGATQIHSSIDSTLTTNGALIVDGGAGFSKSVNIGSNLGVTGNTTVLGTADSVSTSTGALVVSGGAGFAKAVKIGSTLGVTGNATLGTLNVSGTTIINSATDSMFPTSGALIVDGGAGFAKSVNVGSKLGVTGLATVGSLDVTGAAVINSITDSTLTTNGALIVDGGAGFAKSVNVGSNLGVTGNATVSSTTDSTTTSTGALIVSGGAGFAKAVNVGSTLGVTGLAKVGSLDVTGATVINSTTDSTSSITGALVVKGGMGTAGAVHVGSATASTSSSTGALVVSGGAGISGNANIDGTLKVTNTAKLTDLNDWTSGGALKVSGDVGIGGDMVLNGTGYFNGGSFSLSDQTLKKDVITIDNALDKTLQLNGVYYNWIDANKFKEGRQLGFIAQEVDKIIPELVETTNDGIKLVNYSQMVALLVEAVKEQNNIINDLKKDIDSLKNK